MSHFSLQISRGVDCFEKSWLAKQSCWCVCVMLSDKICAIGITPNSGINSLLAELRTLQLFLVGTVVHCHNCKKQWFFTIRMSHFFIICTLLSLSKFVFFSDSRHQLKATFLGHRWQWTDITSLQSWFNMSFVLGIRPTLTHWGRVKMAAIFKNENVWILIKVSLKFVPKGPINNIPTPIQIMAWRLPADKPLSEPMVIS